MSMVYSETNLIYAEDIAKNSRAYRNFLRPLHNHTTKLDYVYWFRKFIEWTVNTKVISVHDDFEPLLKMTSDEITDLLLDWIDSEKEKGNKGSTIASKICAAETFFEMNRKIWHSKLVRRSIPSDEMEPSGKLPITDKELQVMLSLTNDLRNIALIHFFASTGIRPYAIQDPILRLKHLVKMDYGNSYCYGIRVYDESKDGYWSFLTPEATQCLDRYLNSRDSLNSESPIFITKQARKRKFEHMTDITVRGILNPLVKKSVKRNKSGKNRYDKAIIYMFRKRFNGKLKMKNSVNSNIAEKLMAHKRGLDGTYLQPTREECFIEFLKAIPELTIDPTEKQKFEIHNLKLEKSELEKKEPFGEINDLKQKYEITNQRLELVLDMIENAQKNNSHIFISRRK